MKILVSRPNRVEVPASLSGEFRVYSLFMTGVRMIAIFFTAVFFFLTNCVFAQSNNDIFTRMIGPEAVMDEQATAAVLAGEPGTIHRFDTDGDGLVDTIYMIDNDDRHTDIRQPLLVKIVDEDGDMPATGMGDLDSDLYIADWYGDGTIDRVIDYIDHDGDDDLDEQVLYQWSDMAHFLKIAPATYGGRSYSAAWVRDWGDDNLLWYDCNYEYNQPVTQWVDRFQRR